MSVCTSGNGSIVLLCCVTSNYYVKLLRYGPMSWYRLHYVIRFIVTKDKERERGEREGMRIR